MNQKISILGCGWLGMVLAFELIRKGHQVNGSTTSETKLSKLEANGIVPFVIDICEKDTAISEFLNADILIITIPSKNSDDFKKLIVQIEKSQVRNVVFVSSTSVYPNTNGTVTELTETNNTPLATIEKLITTNAVFESTIIRFGGLFGYDRHPGNFVNADKKVENPEGYVNLIHRDDCIRIIEQIIVKKAWNEIFNACADSHPTRREFYQKEAKKLGRTAINFNEQSDNDYKIVSSQKLKDVLDYEFQYANLMTY